MQGEQDPVEFWERRPGASLSPLRRYRRREPERTLLHGIVRARRSCPSCNARRMEDGAEHLVNDVLPAVPARQWVLSFPRRLRFLAARDKKVASRLLDLFTRALFAWQRRSARRLGVAEPRTAGVTVVQRFGGAINLNVHFHALVPDGVFQLPDNGPARFVPLRPPDDEQVARILRTVIRKVARKIDASSDGGAEEDGFAALQAREVDRRLRFPDPFKHARRSAHLDGYSLHAGVRIHANDREGLERLSRYALRPPLALERLSWGEEGRLLYKMKRPRDGALYLMLTPDELLARLATLVPPPRTHALLYHGLFAPNSKHRARVVQAGRGEGPPCRCGSPRAEPAEATAAKASPDAPSGSRAPSPHVPAALTTTCERTVRRLRQ